MHGNISAPASNIASANGMHLVYDPVFGVFTLEDKKNVII